MTGAHIAYALAMKLRLERAKEMKFSECDGTRPCVMYCGSSQQSVNVVLGKATNMHVRFLRINIHCGLLTYIP